VSACPKCGHDDGVTIVEWSDLAWLHACDKCDFRWIERPPINDNESREVGEK